jgi:hypothetical protein
MGAHVADLTAEQQCKRNIGCLARYRIVCAATSQNEKCKLTRQIKRLELLQIKDRICDITDLVVCTSKRAGERRVQLKSRYSSLLRSAIDSGNALSWLSRSEIACIA